MFYYQKIAMFQVLNNLNHPTSTNFSIYVDISNIHKYTSIELFQSQLSLRLENPAFFFPKKRIGFAQEASQEALMALLERLNLASELLKSIEEQLQVGKKVEDIDVWDICLYTVYIYE